MVTDDGSTVEPIKSKYFARLIGPKYHKIKYITSKSFLPLLKIPNTNAREGIKNTATIQFNKYMNSPFMPKFMAAPIPVTDVIITPDKKVTGSCLLKG